MKFIISISVLLISTLLVSSATATVPTTDKAKKGWHWYEENKKPETTAPEKLHVKKPTPSNETNLVKLDTKWLRENLPKLLDKAQDEPTQDNIAAYFYAQRIAIDKASVFSKNSKEFFMFEEILKESNRRPTESVAILAHKDTTQDNQSIILKKIFSQAGLWVFYASDCPYCHQQFPVLERLVKIFNLSILGISINGITLDNEFPLISHVADYNLSISRQFSVSLTPTIIIVGNDGKTFHPISEGIVPGKELIARILVAARNLGFISEQEFSDSKEVKDISNLSTVIIADKEKLESDPKYLAELLREQLKKSKSSTTNEALIYE